MHNHMGFALLVVLNFINVFHSNDVQKKKTRKLIRIIIVVKFVRHFHRSNTNNTCQYMIMGLISRLEPMTRLRDLMKLTTSYEPRKEIFITEKKNFHLKSSLLFALVRKCLTFFFFENHWAFWRKKNVGCCLLYMNIFIMANASSWKYLE